MRRQRSPPPSKSAEKLTEYLEIVKTAQDKHGFAKRYDVFRRAMNEAQTTREIRHLEEDGLIEGDDNKGYRLTKRGETWLELLKEHRDLVGALT